MALDLWERNEDGPPTGVWMHYTPRSIYFSNIPTGTPTDAERAEGRPANREGKSL